MRSLVLASTRIDLDRRVASSPERGEVRLTVNEAELLAYLAAHADRVVSREELLANVWKYASACTSRACDGAVHRLRAKIEADPANPRWLITVHAVGYRLVSADAPPEALPPPQTGAQARFRAHDRVIDLDRAHVELQDSVERLTGNEVALLRVLWAAQGRAVDRSTLERQVWGARAGRSMTNAVSRLRRKIEADSEQPRVLLTTPDGYRLELGSDELPAALDPAELDPTVGRQEEIAEVTALVEAGERMITLTGPPGVGKTRLARAVARGLGAQALWFDLRDADTADRLLHTLAHGLGIQLAGEGGEALVARAVAGLGRAVLVLDNLEQVVGPAVALLAAVRGRAPQAVLLCTSRVRLQARGERPVSVPPLRAEHAMALFLDRALRPVEAGEMADMEALVQELDGLPLAIELAAARTGLLRVADLRRRTAQHLQLLVSTSPDRREREGSLRASLDVSFALLSAPAQAALAQLSVFDGSAALEAAEQVLALGESFAVDALQELIDSSLVSISSSGRLSLLRVVRAYASEQLGALAAPVELRHGQVYAALARSALASLDGPQEVSARRSLGLEVAQLSAAARRALARGDDEVAVLTAAGACESLLRTGPFGAAIELARAVEARVRHPRDRGRARWLEGRALDAAGRYDEAQEALRAALGHARESGTLEAEVRTTLAALLRRRDRLTASLEQVDLALARAGADPLLRARALAERCALSRITSPRDALSEADAALALARDLGALALQADLLGRRGLVQVALGRWDAAMADYEAAIAQLRELADPRQLAAVLTNLASACRRHGHLGRAEALGREALAMHRQTGDLFAEAVALANLGGVLANLGQPEQALALLSEGVEVARAVGLVRVLTVLHSHLANVHFAEGRHDEAEKHHQIALSLAREQGDLATESSLLSNRANQLGRLGRGEEAVQMLLGVRTLQQSLGRPWSVAITTFHLGCTLDELGRPEQATQELREAAEQLQQTGNPRFAGMALTRLAELAFARGDRDEGELLRSRAIAIFQDLGDGESLAAASRAGQTERV